MTQQEHIAKAATYKLLATLGAAAVLGALMLLPAAVRAQQPRVPETTPPGLNAPHQERNPSQHPELFTLATGRRDQDRASVEVRFVAATTIATDSRRRSAPTAVANPSREVPVEDAAVGTGAPHQERNPSQHPELWVQNAGR